MQVKSFSGGCDLLALPRPTAAFTSGSHTSVDVQQVGFKGGAEERTRPKNGFHPRKTTIEPGGWETTSIKVSTLTDCNTCSPNMMGCWSFTQLSLCEIDMSHFKLSYGLLSQCLTITCACIQCIAMQCIGSWSKIENINLQTFFLHLQAKYKDSYK